MIVINNKLWGLKRLLLLLAYSIFFSTALFAQTLPKVQNISVWAPATIKVDGKLAEWPNQQLNAYNPLTRIFYVISNDNDNLYLTVHGAGPGSGFKILKEGLIFTVSHLLNKDREADTNNVSIRFPTPQSENIVSSIMYAANQANKLYVSNPVKNKKQIDSITTITNARVGQLAKEIGIKGIKEIHDSTLSVYNDIGIKTWIQFLNGAPVLEMAVPLKYLHLAGTSDISFSYNINLPTQKVPPGFDIRDITKGGESTNDDDLFRLTNTSFWGVYTLAKKP